MGDYSVTPLFFLLCPPLFILVLNFNTVVMLIFVVVFVALGVIIIAFSLVIIFAFGVRDEDVKVRRFRAAWNVWPQRLACREAKLSGTLS